MRRFFVGIVFVLFSLALFSQEGIADNTAMDLITTCGNMFQMDNQARDCFRTIIFVVPEAYNGSFYVRIFDPDCGGEHDLSNGLWETNTEFEVYGGEGCINLYSNVFDDKEIKKSTGTLLQEELFAYEPIIDDTWVTFGPFKAEQGDKHEEFKARFFKLIVRGTTGNDGNQYAVFLSSFDDRNEKVDGASLYLDSYAVNEDLKSGKYNYSISAEPLE